ncbi:uncharacterized protein IUM83_07624 [Phytophthora cinnamomi]|uniref:uncharacterized protein n=1 Tax=Phytophthora cinnamomi TaxID=4785 RepID=UPI00355A36C8|nr:hypothetical protein IUM83_07624 [Phytophthora cinnamomi]
MVVAFTRSSVAPAKLSAGANGCNERTNQSSSRSQQNPIVLPALIAQPASLWAPHCAFGGAKVPRCKPSEAIISSRYSLSRSRPRSGSESVTSPSAS